MAGQTIGHLKKDKRTKKQKQADFLGHFSALASVSRAAQKSKVARSTFYEWLKADKEFNDLYIVTCEQAVGALEDEAIRRAFEGTNKPVYQGGKKVGSIKEFSDTLMIVLLKARAPEKYKDRMYQELAGKNGGAIQSELKIVNITSAVPIAENEEDVS